MNGANLKIYRLVGSCYGWLPFKIELHWPSGLTQLSKFLQDNVYIFLLSYPKLPLWGQFCHMVDRASPGPGQHALDVEVCFA
jgi:hypothetical protein